MTHDQHKTRLMKGGLSGNTILANDADIVNHLADKNPAIFIQKSPVLSTPQNTYTQTIQGFAGNAQGVIIWRMVQGGFEGRDIQALRPLKPLRPLQKKPLKPLQKKPLKPLKPLKKRKQTEKPCGYNATSLKNWQHPATVSRFIYTPNQGKRVSTYTHIRTPLGVWAIGNDPADQFGESTPAFIGGLSISKTGGQHG